MRWFLSTLFLVASTGLWAQQPIQLTDRSHSPEKITIDSTGDSLCHAVCGCDCTAAKKEAIPPSAAAPKMRVAADVGGLLLPPLGVIGFRYEARVSA